MTPTDAESIEYGKTPNVVEVLLERYPRLRLPALTLAAILVLLGLAVAAMLLWYAVPIVWRWGTAPFIYGGRSNWAMLLIIPSLVAISALFLCAVGAVMAPGAAAGQIIRWYAEAPAAELARQVDQLAEQQERKEQELEREDRSGLILLVSYSRMQLQAYYKIGLTQTQRSFRYSIVAMWLGFVVILAGLIYQVVPVETWSTISPASNSASGPAQNASQAAPTPHAAQPAPAPHAAQPAPAQNASQAAPAPHAAQPAPAQNASQAAPAPHAAQPAPAQNASQAAPAQPSPTETAAERVPQAEAQAQKTDVKTVALAGSTVIEMIAALFLWVYRSSIAQLTYFYNRQMHIHNVVMCYRMAASMKEPDTAVGKIIDKVLEQTWGVEQQPLPSGKVVSELYGDKKV